MTYTFFKVIPNPSLDLLEDEGILVEVSYRMEDIGVLMKRDEHVVPVLKSVEWEGRELLVEIDEVLRRELEEEAMSRWRDERALHRFGEV